MSAALLEVENLSKSFAVRRGFLGGSVGSVQALSDVSFSVEAGEAFGLVGESGCGKSTAGRSILRLTEPDAGRVRFKGEDVLAASAALLRRLRREMQIVFQDPYSSLNPRRTIGQTLAEPMRVHRRGTRSEIAAAVRAVLAEVGMPSDAADKYPHEFSASASPARSCCSRSSSSRTNRSRRSTSRSRRRSWCCCAGCRSGAS
jgi:ABC-type glutathione transport system ATPase component